MDLFKEKGWVLVKQWTYKNKQNIAKDWNKLKPQRKAIMNFSETLQSLKEHKSDRIELRWGLWSISLVLSGPWTKNKRAKRIPLICQAPHFSFPPDEAIQIIRLRRKRETGQEQQIKFTEFSMGDCKCGEGAKVQRAFQIILYVSTHSGRDPSPDPRCWVGGGARGNTLVPTSRLEQEVCVCVGGPKTGYRAIFLRPIRQDGWEISQVVEEAPLTQSHQAGTDHFPQGSGRETSSATGAWTGSGACELIFLHAMPHVIHFLSLQQVAC